MYNLYIVWVQVIKNLLGRNITFGMTSPGCCAPSRLQEGRSLPADCFSRRSQIKDEKTMDHARCADDGQIYNAVEFSRLFPNELERKRRFLRCPECGWPAFFRHTSPIGRAPCFGERPHATGCRLAAYDVERLQSMADEDSQLNSSRTIVVDLRYGTPGQSENVACTERSPVSGDFGCGACRPDLRMHRRPSSLLRQLIESPAFGNSGQPIEIFGNRMTSARDLFVPLTAVTPSLEGQFRGFWGSLLNAKLEGQTIWFNSGDWDAFSFCLDSRFLSDLNRRYAIENVRGLADAYILVFGTLRVSQLGKPFCVIEDLDEMALTLTWRPQAKTYILG